MKEYFKRLATYSGEFLASLPIALTPQPLEYALQRLSPAIDSRKAEIVADLRLLEKPARVFKPAPEAGVGLNTVGLLTDRLTILLIKEWSLRNKAGANPAKADELFNTQTMDIIAALAEAKPGSSALNTKLTRIRADAVAADWEDAYFGLLATNLIIWESQEVLYIKDIGALPAEELRDYIRWFSFGNIRRNEYIQLCDEYFWNNAHNMLMEKECKVK